MKLVMAIERVDSCVVKNIDVLIRLLLQNQGYLGCMYIVETTSAEDINSWRFETYLLHGFDQLLLEHAPKGLALLILLHISLTRRTPT